MCIYIFIEDTVSQHCHQQGKTKRLMFDQWSASHWDCHGCNLWASFVAPVGSSKMLNFSLVSYLRTYSHDPIKTGKNLREKGTLNLSSASIVSTASVSKGRVSMVSMLTPGCVQDMIPNIGYAIWVYDDLCDICIHCVHLYISHGQCWYIYILYIYIVKSTI